eukprot:COSAG01_NODE_1164_length_11447_cov_19.221096_4_plen_136_part_00
MPVVIKFVTKHLQIFKLKTCKGEKNLVLSELEMEAKRPEHDGVEEEYATLALQFGFVTQFATALPLAPLLACLSNIVEIRGDLFKICELRRPAYKQAEDIGTFDAVFQSFGVVAVMTNSMSERYGLPASVVEPLI